MCRCVRIVLTLRQLKRIGVKLAIVSLPGSLSLETDDEGVETAAEYELNSGSACDEIQGYYHARPMPAEDLLKWLSISRFGE